MRPPRDLPRSFAPVVRIQVSSGRGSVEARDRANGQNPSPELRRDLPRYSGLVFLSSSLEPGRLIGRKVGQGNPSQSHFRHPIIFRVVSPSDLSHIAASQEDVRYPCGVCVPWPDALLEGGHKRAGPPECENHLGRLVRSCFFIMRSLASAESPAGRAALPVVELRDTRTEIWLLPHGRGQTPQASCGRSVWSGQTLLGRHCQQQSHEIRGEGQPRQ